MSVYLGQVLKFSSELPTSVRALTAEGYPMVFGIGSSRYKILTIMTKTSFFCNLYLILTLLSCGGNQPTENTHSDVIEKDENGVENFAIFHNKFMSDSAFQMQRIYFPVSVDTVLNKRPGEFVALVEEEDWKILSAIDPEKIRDGSIVTKFEKMGADFIRQHIVINKMAYMYLDFSLDKHRKQWELVYYMEPKAKFGNNNAVTNSTDSSATKDEDRFPERDKKRHEIIEF